MDVNIRKKRAVLLATTPASFTAAFVALSPRIAGHRGFQIVLGVWLLICVVCFALSLRELAALKRERNAA